ncbi:MAG: ester cyclase [Gammaproteobacteria bacterium]|jgi:predicted ester cyclase
MGQSATVVREACEVIWSRGEVERVPEFYAEHFEADYPFTQWGEGLRGVETLAKQVRRDLPGYTEKIEELIEAGSEVVVRLTITGRHPQTGSPVSFRDMTILTVEEGKITRQRGLSDHLSLFLQLGLLELPGS